LSIVNFGVYRLFILLLSMISMCGSLPSELLTGLHNQSKMKSYTYDGEMNVTLEFEKGIYNAITDKSIRDIPIDFAVEFAGKTKYDKDKRLKSQCKLDFDIMDLKFSSDVFVDFDKENVDNKTVLIKIPRFLMISMGLGHMDVDYIEYNMDTLARLLNQEALLNSNLEYEESLEQDKKGIVEIFQVLGECLESRNIIQDKGYLVVERKGKKETLRKVEVTLNREDMKVMLNNLIDDKAKLDKILDFMLMTQLDEDKKAIKDNFLSDYLNVKEELEAGIND